MKRFKSLIPDRTDVLLFAGFATIVCTLFLVLTRHAHSGEGHVGRASLPVDLFALPVEPASASSAPSLDRTAAPVDLFAVPSEPPAQIDARPVIDAYSIDGCIPCRTEEKEVGEGNDKYRVRWHRSTDGEDFPWHIHNFARRHGYPVHHYTQDGQGKRSSGRMNKDQLAALVAKPK